MHAHYLRVIFKKGEGRKEKEKVKEKEEKEKKEKEEKEGRVLCFKVMPQSIT